MTFPRPLVVAFAALSLAGCYRPSGPRPTAAAAAGCRAEVDRVFAAQNRGDLTFRDQRDNPFSSDYFPGNTPRGLGSEYGRDNDYAACIANSGGGATPAAASPPAANIGPVFVPSPTAQ